MRTTHLILALGAFFMIVLVVWLVLRPGAAPWTSSGTLTILVDAVPEPGAPDSVLDVGVRTMRIHTTKGGTETLTLGATRIALDPHHSTPHTLQALEVPIGTYTALSFELRSPALRNNWQGDMAPEALVLAHEAVHIPFTFDIVQDEETVVHMRLETARAIRTDTTGEFTLPVYLPALTLDVWQGARIAQDERGVLSVSGGTLRKSTFFGQQWDGAMREHKRAKDRVTPDEPEQFIPEFALPEQSTTTKPTDTTTATSTNESAATTTEAATKDMATSTNERDQRE